jgi:zinc/manganese transport system substrate-binding protein
MHRQRLAAGYVAAVIAFTLAAPAAAANKIKVVASTTDLGSIASAVGGDQVEVTAIAKPGSDVHRVEVLPSSMVRVSKAQVYLKVGLGLDQWADAIIDGSRNTSLTIVDCSAEVSVLDKPSGRVDASQGDVHPNGNPHYWLDPHEGGVAKSVAAALGRVDPSMRALTRRGPRRSPPSATRCGRGRSHARPSFPSRTLITYHASWIYFAHALGLEIVGTVEPVPEFPPPAAISTTW